ncbi:MAG: NUDIX hydrolase, partial [Ilumatobacteraceae bacterium]
MNAPPPADEVPAKPAATVVLVRDVAPGTTDGVEVFVLRRTANAAFAAGMYVFPGGRVDEIDGADSLEPYCDGLDDATASALLGIERGGLAYWVAAVRECYEEAGLLLARTRDGGPPPIVAGERSAVHAGTLSMEELCRRHDLVLDLSAIRYVAHWVTPFGESSRRFDTRFFLAAAPEGQVGVHDGAELDDSMWVTPRQAIATAEDGGLLLMPPTITNLRFIADCVDADDALARADAVGTPARIQPKLRRDAEGTVRGV